MIVTPITDTHVHLLKDYLLPYRSLRGDFTLGMYDRDSEDIHVENIVFVECDCEFSHSHEEVAFATGIALVDKRIKSIVASAQLEKGEAVEQDLRRFSAHPLVKSVRRLLRFAPDDLCVQDEFVTGVRLLGEFGLSCELCTNVNQNSNAARLIAKCPDISFIIDHIASPDMRGGGLSRWKTDLQRLSEFPSVWCKVSSLATEMGTKTWTKGDIRPYFEHTRNCFGIDRLVFGSDWPVSLSAASFRQSVELIVDLMEDNTEEEREKVLYSNARKFYRF